MPAAYLAITTERAFARPFRSTRSVSLRGCEWHDFVQHEWRRVGWQPFTGGFGRIRVSGLCDWPSPLAFVLFTQRQTQSGWWAHPRHDKGCQWAWARMVSAWGAISQQAGRVVSAGTPSSPPPTFLLLPRSTWWAHEIVASPILVSHPFICFCRSVVDAEESVFLVPTCQPVFKAVSTPCQASRGLAGHPRCVRVGNGYGKMRLYSPIRSKTNTFPLCARYHSAQRERSSPSRRGDESVGKRSKIFRSIFFYKEHRCPGLRMAQPSTLFFLSSLSATTGTQASQGTTAQAHSNSPPLEEPTVDVGVIPAAESSPVASPLETGPPLSSERHDMASTARVMGPACVAARRETFVLQSVS